MKILFYICCFIVFGAISLHSQKIDSYSSYESLSKEFQKDNDTVYIVNFWATWCKPCVKELPYFESIHKSNINKKVKVILVSLDFTNQIESHLLPFLSKNNYSARTILLTDKDYNNWLELVDKEWSGAIPATLLIQGNKKLFAEQEFESEEDLTNFIHSFISSL